MKTLPIRMGARLTIRAIAFPSEDGGRDKCETLAFLQEYRERWSSELEKLTAVLSDVADNGPTRDTTKFKKLKGSDLYEFKSPQGLRLLCFWGDGIICTHGYVKDSQKAPKNEIDRAERLKSEYTRAKEQGTLTHVEPKCHTV
jgi:phage-related protein